MCARLEEERRGGEERRAGLEKEREELRTQLRDATNEVRGRFSPRLTGFRISVITAACLQICRLESAIQQREKKGPEAAAAASSSSSSSASSRLEEELRQTQARLARLQDEAERQRERQQKEVASLRADKHRLEEKVLEQSRLHTERSLLDQGQRQTEDRIR